MNRLLKTLKTKTAAASLAAMIIGGCTNYFDWKYERFLLSEPPAIAAQQAKLDRDFATGLLKSGGAAASLLAIFFRGVSKKGFSDD